MLKIMFILIFAAAIYWLIRHRLHVKLAADLAEKALYPVSKDEFDTLLIPADWKEMKPITKQSKSYQMVKWGTAVLALCMFGAVWLILTADSPEYYVLNIVYAFISIIHLVKHPGNLYMLPEGMILNGRYYAYRKVKGFSAEEIDRPHALYGLDSRINGAFKLTVRLKNHYSGERFAVVEDEEHLNKITGLLKQKGVPDLSVSPVPPAEAIKSRF
ncbi:hypothetical protein ACQCVE_13760 [Metabacillus sp. 113a]|uniref:hypothetical protein n=1 Tax=Metabacillus sp. 113a TaxID=3404706 RepID=UPI003CFBBF1A